MARIPDEVVERLKREVSLARLVEASGVELKRHGENVIGRCPFHDDRTPSLVITPSKNLWHCLGACQAGGTVIDWVMRREKCSYRAALELLLKDAPSLAAPLDAAPPRTTTAKLEEIAKPEEPDHIVLGRVVDYYHSTLKESPEALSYLESRGLKNVELINAFKLGFANRTLGYRLPPKQVKAGEAMRTQLQRLGVLRESGHEHFNGSIVVPVFDAQGQVVEMYGRKITPGLRAGTPLHLYLPGPHRGIVNPQAFSAGGDIILCEAILDALTFWSAGFVNVTTSYGVEGFTPELRDAFASCGKKRVLIAYDRDEAGDKAAEKLASELAVMGHEVFRVLFPRGMDANEYAQKVKPATKSLGTALQAAHWMAGTRPVLVPKEYVIAHAEATVSAETVKREEDAPLDKPTLTVDAPELDDAVAFAKTAESEAHPSLAASIEGEREREEELHDAQPTSATAASAPMSTSGEKGDVLMRFGAREWRVRGLEKATSLSSIKVNVRVTVDGVFFTDTLDVLAARARASFLKQGSEELGLEERVLKSDLGKVLLELERLVEAQLKKTLEPVKDAPVMSEAERNEALSLLKDPKLLDRIVVDFARCGVVGEETNKLVAYLAATSRKLHDPLALVIQSSSAAGKSSLMDAVLRFVPEEEKAAYAAMTGQALFYMGEANLQHKVLAIAEEEGAKNASYALKILQSSGELTIASTGKDERTGKLMTQEYRVTGPVMIMMTTTAIEVDEELLNRCLVVTVDEGAEQTRAIHARQREAETLEGMAAQAAEQRIMRLHQNAQRLLKPLRVVNPYAKELSFASHATRTRRDHKKYLTLIRSIALLHQHQRELKEYQDGATRFRYIEVTREDIELASRLAGRVLARGLDELAPQTRCLLRAIDTLVTERAKSEGIERSDVRFTQRELREYARWSATQVKVQLKRLEELEYVVVHRGGGHRQRGLYELCVSTSGGAPSPFEEKHEYDPNRSGFSANRSAHFADWSGTGPGPKRPVFLSDDGEVTQPVREIESAHRSARNHSTSYTHDAAE